VNTRQNGTCAVTIGEIPVAAGGIFTFTLGMPSSAGSDIIQGEFENDTAVAGELAAISDVWARRRSRTIVLPQESYLECTMGLPARKPTVKWKRCSG